MQQQHPTLLRHHPDLQVYGIYWVLAATASYRLSKAAEQGNLSSETYQRLNALLALFTAASAVPFLQGAAGGELSPIPAAVTAATLAATAATTFAPGYLSSGGTRDLAEVAAGLGNALKSTVKAGRGLTGAFYSLNFWEDFILGIALLGGPILPTVVSGDAAHSLQSLPMPLCSEPSHPKSVDCFVKLEASCWW